MRKHSSDLYPIGFPKPKKPNDNWVYWLLAGLFGAITILAYSLLK